MPIMKVTDYTNHIKSITAIPDHYVCVTGVMKTTNAVEVDGKKVIPAGTCVTNALTGGRVSGLTAGASFDGVIVNTEEVDPDNEYVNVTVMIHGFVRGKALVPPTATSSNPLIVIL